MKGGKRREGKVRLLMQYQSEHGKKVSREVQCFTCRVFSPEGNTRGGKLGAGQPGEVTIPAHPGLQGDVSAPLVCHGWNQHTRLGYNTLTPRLRVS